MPSREYEINHPYALARALEGEVKMAIYRRDDAVVDSVRGVIMKLAQLVDDYDKIDG
jgi:hypothetical protein